MLTEQRQNEIVSIVNEKKSVLIKDLTTLLGASESTLRRDIIALSKEGRLIKVFGGAIAIDGAPNSRELSVVQKETINIEEKRKIAKYAAGLIKAGDFVFIDSGTTTGFMLEFITEKDATYVTNAVAHAKRLASSGFKVLLIGGELKETTEAIVGADAILHIQKYNFSKGFFGTNGVSSKVGFTTPDVREALVKRVALENTQPGGRMILADHDKFGEVSSVTFAEFDGCMVVTDVRPEETYTRKMRITVV